jgi:hypothetical protein
MRVAAANFNVAANVVESAVATAKAKPINEIADKLQNDLGQQLSAFGVGIRDPRLIGRYARGEAVPSREVDTRLRDLHAISEVILTRHSSNVLRAWMLGSNDLLEDAAPIEVIHVANVGGQLAL